MVTSSRRGEGKSTSAACFALALAREFPQERVALVDLDTRRATLGGFFGVNAHSQSANGDGRTPGARGGALVLSERKWTGEFAELTIPNLLLLLPSIVIYPLQYIAIPIFIAAIVFENLILYKAWNQIQDGCQRTTPLTSLPACAKPVAVSEGSASHESPA